MNKIIIFGAYGSLGTELQKLNPDLICPTKKEVDIRYEKEVRYFIKSHQADIVINAAAVIDNRVLETMPAHAINTNIIGAANIAAVCLESNIRLVYISTDYIYRGDRGNYSETDEILPFNFYAWTKLGGECSAHGVKNHLIIRTSFGKNEFPYPKAFVDKWSSKDYVSVIAPLIYEAALSPLTGVLNLGTDRKTLYAHAKERNPDVEPVKISETSFFSPHDSSLNLQKWINFKSEKSIAKPHDKCRICGSNELVKYLDLGLMPLANNLETTSQAAKSKERFPLQVMFCHDCGLSQLSVVIDPQAMFGHYVYRSSVNKPYVEHCRKMAIELQDNFCFNSDCFMVDIAGNDGALLKQFKEQIGLKVLNVDPASNLVAIAEAQGIESIADFWSLELAEKIEEKYGKANLITATNVFAHVDGVTEFIQAAKRLLAPEGILVLEFPYLIDFIEGVEFDTIYFEHLSYMSILPLNKLCNYLGMNIVNIQKQDIHGGTVRVTITDQNSHIQVRESVWEFLNTEQKNGFDSIKRYSNWGESVKKTVETFSNNILELKKQGFRIACIGASAKVNTLMNAAGITTDLIDYIVDDTSEKIGKYSPGTGIPIMHPQTLEKHPVDYLLIGSWNFTEALIARAVKAGHRGAFIIGIPEFKIIDNPDICNCLHSVCMQDNGSGKICRHE